MTTDLAIPDVTRLQQDMAPRVAQGLALTVTDAASYEQAGIIFRTLGEQLRTVEAFFKPIKQSLDAHKKTILDRQRLVAEPLEASRSRCNTQMVDWREAQEKQRREDEQRARDTAAMAEAEHHERLGDHTAADEALSGRGAVAVSLPPTPPKLAGVSQRETYVATVIDLLALVKAVASGQVPVEAVLPNMVYLNREARTQERNLKIPGVVPQRKVTMAG